MNIDETKVDVEEPNAGIHMMTLGEAKTKYKLNKDDVEDILAGRILWVHYTAISKSEEDE